MILIYSLVSNLSVSACSVCVPQYPKRDIVLLWTIFRQAIARLDSRVAYVADFEHCQFIAITKNGLCALLDFPDVIVLLLLES